MTTLVLPAIKKCKWDYSQLTPIQLKRWTNEVNIMKRLRHPNIIRCTTFDLPNVDERLPILCMEYCKKGDLRKVVFYLNHINCSMLTFAHT